VICKEQITLPTKVKQKSEAFPNPSILDRLRAAPADKLPVKPTTEIEESDRLLAQLRIGLAACSAEVVKYERARQDPPAEVAQNYVRLRRLVGEQEARNAATRQKVDQAHFEKMRDHWVELQRERIQHVEEIRKVNEQLDEILAQCAGATNVPLRDWSSSLFFGCLARPGVAGLRYHLFLQQARGDQIISPHEHRRMSVKQDD
jgi:hypothetical protein